MIKTESKIITIDSALKNLNSSMTIGLSGFSYMNPPMALVREIIKKKIKNLTLVSGPTSGIETDILIGAGCVKKVITSCVAFEKIEGVATNFRKAVENNSIEVWECDECIWHIALKAGIQNVPYMLWPGGVGSSIPKLNKDIEEVKIKGDYYLKIPPIKIDISFIHCGIADKIGNVQFPKNIFLGRLFCEQELAESSKKVVCSVEKIVDNRTILQNPERIIIRNAEILEIPFGAHPGASNGFYIPDLDHYKEYVEYSKKGKFNEYLEKYIFGVNSQNEYLNLIGKNRLKSLEFKKISKN